MEQVSRQRKLVYGFSVLSVANGERTIDVCPVCLMDIARGSLKAFSTMCCGHYVHADCQWRWRRSLSWCARPETCFIFRTPERVGERCYMCLGAIEQDGDIKQVSCCQAPVQKTCYACLVELAESFTEGLDILCSNCIALQKCEALYL